MNRLKLTVLSAAALLAVIGSVAATWVLRTSAQFVVECTLDFEATIREGPTEGTVLSGELKLTVEPSGATTGEWTTENATIRVVGQIIGRAVNLVFTMPEGGHMFGVGTSLGSVTENDCGGMMGGSFVGPMDGDRGDWLGCRQDGDSRAKQVIIEFTEC